MRTRIILIIVVILVAGIGAYLLREYVQYYILFPMVISFRIVRIIFQAIPQVFFWVFFLFLGWIVIIVTFSSRRKVAPKTINPSEKFESRARQYSLWIKTSQKNDYSRWMLARKLFELTVNLLAFQERLSTDDAIKNIKQGMIVMPPEVRDYLLAGWDMPSFRHFSEARKYWRINLMSSPLEVNPETIIKFLESRF